MKKSALLLLMALSVTGCEQYARLVDGDGPRNRMDPPVAAGTHGAWRGTVIINGIPEQLGMYFNVSGSTITSGLMSIQASPNLYLFCPTVTGTADGGTVSATATEKTYCTNPWTFQGTISGNAMTGTLTGLGNATGSCYPNPINGTFSLTKL